MCKCGPNVKMGDYSNQTAVPYPDWFVTSRAPEQRIAGIDNCILEEVMGLWEAGIQTIESCCGHNVSEPYIAVVESDVWKMRSIGYENYPRVDRNQIFKAKSVEYLPINVD